MRDPLILSSGVGKFPLTVPSNPSLAPNPRPSTFACDVPRPGVSCASSRLVQCLAVDSADTLRLAALSSARAPTANQPPSGQPPALRPSSLVTYCDHCGYNLVGAHDTLRDWVELRCPTSKDLKQVLRDRDLAEWPEWALRKVERMLDA